MSFESIPMAARGNTVRDRVSIQNKGVVFRLDNATLDKLGWKSGDCIDIQVGRDDHYGIVQLLKKEHGRKLHPQGRNSESHTGLVVNLGRHKMGGAGGGETLPEMPPRLPSTPIIIEIVGGAAQFRLPWIVPPNETSTEAIKRGFPVTRVPSPASKAWANGGNPVRTKASEFHGGRVR